MADNSAKSSFLFFWRCIQSLGVGTLWSGVVWTACVTTNSVDEWQFKVFDNGNVGRGLDGYSQLFYNPFLNSNTPLNPRLGCRNPGGVVFSQKKWTGKFRRPVNLDRTVKISPKKVRWQKMALASSWVFKKSRSDDGRRRDGRLSVGKVNGISSCTEYLKLSHFLKSERRKISR